jgi:tyrosine-protein phosphatase YwqE
LPGIDDGVETIEDSIEVIRGFKNLGFSKLITTPHVMHDFYKNDTATIKAKLKEVRDAVTKANLNIEIDAAAEYYLDEHFIELIESDQPLLSFGENYVLFELSFVSKPMTLREVIFKLQTKNYKPVLAHPERYLYYHKNINELRELTEAGTLLQLNLLSLAGYYSPEVKKNGYKAN